MENANNIKNVDIMDSNICIPIRHKQAGGLYRFIETFRGWLDNNGFCHNQDIDSAYDILFVNSFMVDHKLIARAKRKSAKLRVVQRMDGSARDYGRNDNADYLQARVNLLADLTIFQSNYAKYATMTKYKVVTLDGPVIYNPVDTDVFCSEGPKLNLPGKIKICNSSFSTNPKKGTWRIGKLAQDNPDITFILCGRYPELPDLPNIINLGLLDKHELAKAMRSCDVFLFLSENEACANVITEALASGLPVLYIDSGSNSELVGDCGMPVDADNFRERLMTVIENRSHLSHMAREKAVVEHSPDVVFKKYIDAMQHCVRRDVPTTVDYIKLALKGYPVIDFTIPNPADIIYAIRRKAKTLIHGN